MVKFRSFFVCTWFLFLLYFLLLPRSFSQFLRPSFFGCHLSLSLSSPFLSQTSPPRPLQCRSVIVAGRVSITRWVCNIRIWVGQMFQWIWVCGLEMDLGLVVVICSDGFVVGDGWVTVELGNGFAFFFFFLLMGHGGS